MTADCPTPREVAERVASAARRDLVRRLRIIQWNQQMEAVVDVIIDAHAAGRGVMITTSASLNTITARSTKHVRPGRAAIFDLDADDTRPTFRTIRPEHLRRTT